MNVLSPYLKTLAFSLVGAISLSATAESTNNRNKDVGRTSYAELPFQRDVYDLCWNCSSNLEPAQLFFEDNPRSVFNNPARMHETHVAVAAQEASGLIPSAGIQRWESTYAASFPVGTFDGEPNWVQADRDRGLAKLPEFAAWRDWIAHRPQYWDRAADGGTMPVAFRAWGGSWGFISPLTPLALQDCPPGTKSGCTWGDDFAYRWSLSAAKSGAYGLILSDFSDSQPAAPSNIHDFNPRIVTAFIEAGLQPGVAASASGSLPEQADWIVTHQFNEWNDFVAAGYAKFFAALNIRVGGATGKRALIVDQCGLTPAFRRLYGIDARIIARTLPPQNYLCMWDDHAIQADRVGPVAAPPMQELAGFAIAAAREPLIRNGANLEADDPAYWTAITKFYPTLDHATQREVGDKLLKRLWLWSSWAYIADRVGNVRRALALTSRDYWDGGSLTALAPLTDLIRQVIPTRPFGAALYYSVAVERAFEQAQGAKIGTGNGDLDAYLPPADLQSFIDVGAPVGYYVSDAALPAIAKSTANAPSAWVVLDAAGLLPPTERDRLTAIAPIATSADALAALPDQPLTLPHGLAGFGFYSQKGQLIVVISNPATAADAQTVSGDIRLTGLTLSDGTHVMRDLFAGKDQPISVSRHGATIPVRVARWDTIVFSIPPR